MFYASITDILITLITIERLIGQQEVQHICLKNLRFLVESFDSLLQLPNTQHKQVGVFEYHSGKTSSLAGMASISQTNVELSCW